jgi:hypothetical protein
MSSEKIKIRDRRHSATYRARNKDKVLQSVNKSRAGYIDELKDCYVVNTISRRTGLTASEVRGVEGLIDTERIRIKLLRAIKTKKNEK